MQIQSCTESAIFPFFIFNTPDSKCIIILQCVPGNTPNFGELIPLTYYYYYYYLFIYFYFFPKYYINISQTPLPLLCAYCLFQQSAFTSAEERSQPRHSYIQTSRQVDCVQSPWTEGCLFVRSVHIMSNNKHTVDR
jgi:hypothetical protein